MGFAMFSASQSPIAIDFGSASLKLLQISTGDRPALVAAAEVAVPDSARSDTERLTAFYAEQIPKTLREGKFKGKRCVIAVPSAQTFIQHMQIAEGEGASRDALVKAQLQSQIGCQPDNIVVRVIEVGPVHRHGTPRTELICLAIGKDTVMGYLDLLKRCRLEVAGVHTETLAMMRAFDHLNRRQEDSKVTTLYIDMGWAGTRVAISHGPKIVFARYIPIGGRNFDQLIADAVHCDSTSARAHRLSLEGTIRESMSQPAAASASTGGQGMGILSAAMAQVGGSAGEKSHSGGVATAVAERRTGAVPRELAHSVKPGQITLTGVSINFAELLDTVADELSMCLRYHQGLFRNRPIDRTIFVGGESRQAWLCQHIVKELRLSAQMGDPLARLTGSNEALPATPGLTLGKPQPGWAVPCGLCTAPTDL